MIEYQGKVFWQGAKLREKYPDAQIYFVLGERSDGKSYDLKSYTIEKALLNENDRFLTLRRFRNEITRPRINKYYSNTSIWTPEQPLNVFTDNEFNRIDCAFGEVNAVNSDTKEYKKLGYYGALEDEQDFAGFSLLDVNTIVFEEAISRTKYLDDECNKLMNFYSTIDRRRGTTKLFMLGNPLGKHIPYFIEWGISDHARNLKQGEMCCFYIPMIRPDGSYPYGRETLTRISTTRRKDYVKLAWEWIAPSGNASYIIGTHAGMLANGSFQTDTQAKLADNYKNYKLYKRVIFNFDNVMFIAEFRVKKDKRFWFIYPKTNKEIKKHTRVISNIPNNSYYYSTRVEGHNKAETEYFKYFNNSNLFYSDDDCGTYFNQLALNYLKIKL